MSSKFEKFKLYFYYFLIYSFIGWIYEVIIFLYMGEGFVNRGFLFGPYLPVYGFGGIIILLLLGKLMKKKVKIGKVNIMPFLIFLLISFIATVVELGTSYILDIFNLELWNYNEWAINFEGRIALIPSLRFGALGVIILYLLQPFFEKKLNKMNDNLRNIIFYILFVIIIIDFIVRIIKMFI